MSQQLTSSPDVDMPSPSIGILSGGACFVCVESTECGATALLFQGEPQRSKRYSPRPNPELEMRVHRRPLASKQRVDDARRRFQVLAGDFLSRDQFSRDQLPRDQLSRDQLATRSYRCIYNKCNHGRIHSNTQRRKMYKCIKYQTGF